MGGKRIGSKSIDCQELRLNIYRKLFETGLKKLDYNLCQLSLAARQPPSTNAPESGHISFDKCELANIEYDFV